MGHLPVLAAAACDLLVWDPDGLYVDGTIGCAGHALAILSRLSPKGRLWGFDWDQAMLAQARAALAHEDVRVRLFHEPFSLIGGQLAAASTTAHGILIDLGLNSAVLNDRDRGFSYKDPDAPLDMRMDRTRPQTAAELLGQSDEEDLARIFRDLGEARRPRAAARAVVHARERAPLRTAGDLVRALRLARAIPGGPSELSRIFQAIRFAVNGELEDLDRFLEGAPDWILPGGRLVVISYESQSDRRVKMLSRQVAGGPRAPAFRAIHRRVVRPDRDEIRNNPRARSAKLRALERMV